MEPATSASFLSRWIAPERAFAVIALVFGNALVLVIPPFQAADESFHFLRAYQITDGVFVSRQPDARGVPMGEFPVSLFQVWLPFSHMGFNPSVKASLQDIRDALRIRLNPNRRMQIALPSTAYYSPACYLPQCLGIIVGRALGVGPLAMLYLGREANLLAWTLLGYVSLRSASAIARPLFLLLLMPMSMYLASTLSADVSTTAFAVLFTATVLKYSVLPEPDSIGPGRLLILLMLSLAVCLCKFAYAPLLALLLLIPPRNFGRPARYAAQILILAAASAWAWFFTISVGPGLDAKIRLTDDVSARAQLDWLTHHPLRFAPVLLQTFHLKGWVFLQGYVGLIGWLDRYLPAAFVIGYLILLVLACLPNEDKPRLPRPRRAAVIVLPAVVCSFLIIALLDYLYWTPVRAALIDGFTGRYLIPLSPAVLLVIASAMRHASRFRLPYSARTLNTLMILVSLFACIYFLAVVWNRYYG
ncbi:MAG: DUF2142 domain-containing protein [Tepidisphaeraceae bacterium]|jgi:uncharacterized membrane protein